MKQPAFDVIWLDGIQGGYHDSKCPCDGHCRYCFDDLESVREGRRRLIEQGHAKPSDQLSSRARYCSPWCKGRAYRERRFDREMAKITVSRA